MAFEGRNDLCIVTENLTERRCAWDYKALASSSGPDLRIGADFCAISRMSRIVTKSSVC